MVINHYRLNLNIFFGKKFQTHCGKCSLVLIVFNPEGIQISITVSCDPIDFFINFP